MSADAGNASRLGTDGKVFTPTATGFLPLAGGTMTGAINLPPDDPSLVWGDGWIGSDGVSVSMVSKANYLTVKENEVMTGSPVTLPADPTKALEAVTKQYVDSVNAQLFNYLPLIGGTLTGQLGLTGSATTPLRFGSESAGNFNLTMLANEGGMNWQFNSSPIILWTKDDIQARKPLVLSADPTNPLQAATKQYVDGKFAGGGYVLPVATGTVLGGVKVGTGLTAAADGTLSAAATPLTPATASVLGGIKVGTGLSVTADGTLSSASAYSLPIATDKALGGVMIGTGLAITAAGVLSAAATPLAPATAFVLGGIKVGAGLAATADGTLSVANAAPNTVNGSVAGMTLWIGTQAQFDAIATKDSKTVYNIQA